MPTHMCTLYILTYVYSLRPSLKNLAAHRKPYAKYNTLPTVSLPHSLIIFDEFSNTHSLVRAHARICIHITSSGICF